jgi:hypothetical protein
MNFTSWAKWIVFTVNYTPRLFCRSPSASELEFRPVPPARLSFAKFAALRNEKADQTTSGRPSDPDWITYRLDNPFIMNLSIILSIYEPLILQGARQVGRTWLLTHFGTSEFDNVAYFNFEEQPDLKQFFENTKEIPRIVQNLSLVHGQPILPQKNTYHIR